MPYVKRTASGRIASVFDRPSREAKERVRANDPELLRFLGLAPTQNARVAVAPVEEIQDRVAGKRAAGTVRSEPDGDVRPGDLPADTGTGEPGGDAPTIDIMEDDLSDERPRGRAAASRPAAKLRRSPAPQAARPQKPPAGPGSKPAAVEPAASDGGSRDPSALQQLDASDLEMARITEDLIDLLIGRNIINFTDFPTMAQRKLITRRALRSNMSALTNLVSDEEAIF